MADLKVTLTIEDVRRADALLWYAVVHPIPQIPDPDWTGDSDDNPGTDQFTVEVWMAERLRRILVNSLALGKQRLETPELDRDDGIVTRNPSTRGVENGK